MKPIDVAQGLDLPRRAVALVLAGGRGSRLKNLTDSRAKPAVYFGGKFRIVDFALSNCLNSGIRRIGVITQYKSHSLLRHLQRGWAFLKSEMNEFVDLLPAQQRVDEESWYRGTADAVYQNQDILAAYRADYVVVLAGDHVYKHELRADAGRPRGAGARVHGGLHRGAAQEATRLRRDGHRRATARILDFVEKPADPPTMPGKPDRALASMGIYIFNARYLYRELERDMADPNSSHDFGKDIIPQAGARRRGGGAPLRPELRGQQARARRRTGATSARSMPTGTPTSTSPPPTRCSTCTTPTGRSGPTSRSCRRPSSCTTRTTGAAWPSSRWSRAAASSRARCSARCCSPACACTRIRTVNWSVLLPGVQVGRGARLTRVVVDRDCLIPDGMVIGEDAGGRRRALPPHRVRASRWSRATCCARLR